MDSDATACVQDEAGHAGRLLTARLGEIAEV